MRRQTIIYTAPLGALLLSACAAGGDYPSLAIRDVERVQGQFGVSAPAAPIIAPTPLPAGLLASLEQLQSDAQASHTDFMAATPRASQLVSSANGAAISSNRWTDAQVALANLEALRSRTAIALAEVDGLYVTATVDAQANTQIAAARDAIVSLVADEDVTLAALRGQLPN